MMMDGNYLLRMEKILNLIKFFYLKCLRNSYADSGEKYKKLTDGGYEKCRTFKPKRLTNKDVRTF